MERCHGLCDQFFWSRHHFESPQEVREHYPDFLHQMRQDYEVSGYPGMTPRQLRRQLRDVRVRSLDPDGTWTEGDKLPLVEGTVHCVRVTDTQARLSAFGQTFALTPEFRRAYIRASLSVAEQRLRFFFQDTADAEPQLIDMRPFNLPDPVRPYAPALAQEALL